MKTGKAFAREGLWILLYCIVGGTAMTYFTCSGCRTSAEDYAYVSLFSTSVWFAMWLGNSLLAHYMDRLISWIDAPVKRALIGVLGTVVYSTAAVGLIMFAWRSLFSFGIGNFYEVVVVTLVLTFFVSMVLHSRSFLINWKKTQIDAEKFQKESIKAQYESLKNQVNPHFLFNSLNALTHLVYEDQDKAAKFIKQLSEVYRYVLDTRDKELVSLQEELKFLESYLFLQHIRFGDNLKVKVSLNGTQSAVAPLALQMLIENAIKHNIISEQSPLTIELFPQKSFLVVENSIHKKATLQDSSPGLGLENIRMRYEFLSKEKVQMDESNGKFTVKLPIIEFTE